jgi:amidase
MSGQGGDNGAGHGRREFLRRGALTGASTLAWASAAAPPAQAQTAASAAPTVPAFEFEEVGLAELRNALQAGKLSARALTAAYLARIDAVQRATDLRAVIEVDFDALQRASELDQERAAGRVRGPLHGIPVLLKDNIDSADTLRTSAGSLALAESVAARDAALVERLRAAGAVILGKTNLSEWANFRSTRSSSGWSARGGQCRNPYALDRSPCGSSSGTGAAIAANLAPVGVGTETDGSIVCPSSANGLVGIKPTVGLISRAGIVPISASQDTAGPMARSVRDAALLLGVLAGVDARDPATQVSGRVAQDDYSRYCDDDGLAGARLGVVRKLAGFLPSVDALFEEALRAMKKAGAELIEVALPHQGEYDEAEFEVLLFEFKAGLNAYLAGLGPAVKTRSLADLIAFNERERGRSMPYFGQELFLRAQEKGDLKTPAYLQARATCQRLSRTEGLDAVLRKQRLDALVAPTGGPAWTIDLINGDHFVGGAASTAPAVSGYPHVTVPAGFVFGLPVGLSFMGAAWTEAALIRLASGFEAVTRHRRAPRFLPTAELGQARA